MNPKTPLGECLYTLRQSISGHKVIPVITLDEAKCLMENACLVGRSTMDGYVSGRRRCPVECLEKLLELGHKYKLDREWGERVANLAGKGRERLLKKVNELWPKDEPKRSEIIEYLEWSNEPRKLVGRKRDIAKLLKVLRPRGGPHLCYVVGIGGVGKTALVEEVVRLCRDARDGRNRDQDIPIFQVIIFLTFKQVVLTSEGLIEHPGRWVRKSEWQIMRKIAEVLRLPTNEFDPYDPEYHPENMINRAALGWQALLVIDNLESIPLSSFEKATEGEASFGNKIMNYFWQTLTDNWKVIFTSRKLVSLTATLELLELNPEDALELLSDLCKAEGVHLNEDQMKMLCKRVGGIPMALRLVVGRIKGGRKRFGAESFENALHELEGRGSNDIVPYLFESSVSLIRGLPAYRMLLATALFPNAPMLDAVVHVAGLNDIPEAGPDVEMNAKICLREFLLIQYSWYEDNRLVILSHDWLNAYPEVESIQADRQDVRFHMNSLLREYTLQELANLKNKDLARSLRERWVKWCRKFAQRNGGYAYKGWYIQYDRLELEWGNLAAVVDWCVEHERYDDVRAFLSRERLLGFTSIYGHWRERAKWLDWLVEKARRKNDWKVLIDALSNRGITLVMLGMTSQAEKVLNEAREVEQSVSDPRAIDGKIRLSLARNLARLYMRTGKYQEALDSLEGGENVLRELIKIPKPERSRQELTMAYQRADIYYHRRAAGDYENAKPLYEYVLESGEKLLLERATLFARARLAAIAAEEERYDRSRDFLEKGLPLARTSKDKLCIFIYLYSYTHLKAAIGDIPAAKRYAEEAQELLSELGMEPNAPEFQYLAEITKKT